MTVCFRHVSTQTRETNNNQDIIHKGEILFTSFASLITVDITR